MIWLLVLVLGTGTVAAQLTDQGSTTTQKPNVPGNTPPIRSLKFNFKGQADGKLPWHIDYRDAIQVQVEGVNPFLYDVAVEGKSHSFNNNAPDGLIAALVPGLKQPADNAEKAAEVAATPMLESLSHHGGNEHGTNGEKKTPDHITHANAAFTRLKDDQAAYAALQAISKNPNLTAEEVDQAKTNWRAVFFDEDPAKTIGTITQERVQCWESCRTEAEMALTDIEQIKALAEMQAALNRAEYQLLPSRIEQLYQQLHLKAFTYFSAPIAPEYNADELVLQIKVSPKSSAENIVGNSTTVFPCTLRVKGGWRLDFSAGVGIGVMPNQEFALVDVDTAMQVVEEQSTYMSVGAMALAHFRYRAAGPITGGISTGVMYDDSQRLRYLLGASTLLGHRQRIVLSVGLAFGKVQLLSKTQSDKATLPTGSELLYVDRFRVGGFFGLSYNFGN